MRTITAECVARMNRRVDLRGEPGWASEGQRGPGARCDRRARGTRARCANGCCGARRARPAMPSGRAAAGALAGTRFGCRSWRRPARWPRTSRWAVNRAPARCWTRCAARGVRVLLPVLLRGQRPGLGGLRGPRLAGPGPARAAASRPGERLGPEAVLAADAVLLPGLAVDARGMRLGRGGGSYDRVLARLARGRARARAGGAAVRGRGGRPGPGEPHDHPVHAVVTPAGVRRFAAP